MSLLPSQPIDVDSSQEGAIRIHDMVGEEANEIFNALSTETSRIILQQIHNEPRTPSDLAEETDTSLQNVTYHLEKLSDAGLIQPAGIQYSSRGQEMDVYTPSDSPRVLFIGTEDRKANSFSFLKMFAGAITVFASISVVIHTAIARKLPFTGTLATTDPQAPMYVLAAFLGALLSAVVTTIYAYTGTSIPAPRPLPHSTGQRAPSEIDPLFAAGATFTTTTGIWFGRQAMGLTPILSRTLLLSALSIGLVCIGMWVSYRGVSIQGCCGIVVAGYLGILGHNIAIVLGGYITPELAVGVTYMLLGSIAGGAVIGTIGYTLGQAAVRVEGQLSRS